MSALRPTPQAPIDAYYPKKQSLSFRNGYRVAEVQCSAISDQVVPEEAPLVPSLPTGDHALPTAPFRPPFVQLDGAVLQFLAHFSKSGFDQEGRRFETVHKAYVRYWPLDGTIAVSEACLSTDAQQRSQVLLFCCPQLRGSLGVCSGK